MRTDFFTRSLDTGKHEAYDGLSDKVMSVITDPRQMETYSFPEQIAEVVYEAATDGKDQLRYVAGEDAKATYAMRLRLGDELFGKRSLSSFSTMKAGISDTRDDKGCSIQKHVLKITRELQKRMRWKARDILDSRRNSRGFSAAIVSVILNESIGLPFGKAETQQGASHRRLRYVHKSDPLTERRREPRG
jgi:hypothetical protein